MPEFQHTGSSPVTSPDERLRFWEWRPRQPAASDRPEELTALFLDCSDEEAMVFRFFLCSGCREQNQKPRSTKSHHDRARSRECW